MPKFCACMEKTFAGSSKTTKFVKYFSLESFPLYGIACFRKVVKLLLGKLASFSGSSSFSMLHAKGSNYIAQFGYCIHASMVTQCGRHHTQQKQVGYVDL